MFAQGPDLSDMLDMSGTRKKKACENLDKMQLKIGPAGVTHLMQCAGAYPVAFKRAKAFCRTDAASDSTAQVCLPSTPLVFQDQHDGDRKLVTLTGNRLSITSFGSTDRLL